MKPKNANSKERERIDQAAEDDRPSFEAIARLSKDLKQAVETMQPREIRYLVDAYYGMQENRKVSDNQIRALSETKEPHRVITWLSNNCGYLENQIKAALNTYVESKPLGQWLYQHVGIGPVISAGLLSHFDITKAPTYGHYWSFAGLTTGFNMPVQWKKGEKRPWNATLKTLCWRASDCFVKFSGRDDCFYGMLYVSYKENLIHRNERGDFKEAADDGLKRVGKTTEAYKSYLLGKLPPGHIDARARRFTVKIFISHFWEESYRQHHGKAPPDPYPIAHLKHAHLIKNPVPSLAMMNEQQE